MKSIILQSCYYLIIFLLISFISLTKAYKYQYSDVQDEKILNIEDKLIYNKNEDIFLTFAVFPNNEDDNTYVIKINKNKKIIGYKGTRILYDDIYNNYITKIKEYNETYITDIQYNSLYNVLLRINYAEFNELLSVDGYKIMIVYKDKIYKASSGCFNDPVISEIIHIIKETSPININYPAFY